MKIHQQTVEVGHFRAQGAHSQTGESYVQMMRKHHTGYSFLGANGETHEVPSRPVIDILGFRMGGLQTPFARRAIREWGKRPFSKTSHNKMLSTLGMGYGIIEKNIFGDPSQMADNASLTQSLKGGRNTPLVDTGELRDKVAYRTSIDNSIKEAG